MSLIVVTGGESFQPSGMTKNGPLKMSGAWSDIIAWTADTTGYPGSELSGNGLLVQGSKEGAAINVTLPFSGGTSSPKQKARIVVNGNPIATGPEVIAGSGTLTATATVALAAGDVVTVQAICEGFSGWESTITAGVGTFVRIT